MSKGTNESDGGWRLGPERGEGRLAGSSGSAEGRSEAIWADELIRVVAQGIGMALFSDGDYL